jgi:hypothetical protein
MKILIDIGHPAHVHLFKNFAHQMQKKGHEFLFTCRQKEFEIELLKAEGFRFVSFGKKYNSTFGKVLGLIKFDILEFIQGLKFKPDVFMSHGSPYAAHASWLLGIPHISLEDHGNMEQIRLYLPFTSCVLTSTAFHRQLGKKQIRYTGCHELAYLHPNNFTPDPGIYKILKIDQDIPYIIIRFVAWNASHDINQSGLTLEKKREIIQHLEKKYVVFISSEKELPNEFKKYQIKIPPEEMHNALAFADMFIGEGATMAAESAVLGTPSVFVNTMTLGYITEQVKYGLLYHFKSGERVLDQIKILESNINLKAEFKKKRETLLNDKIDVTAFMVWFVENYPQSKKELVDNPKIQFKYK